MAEKTQYWPTIDHIPKMIATFELRSWVAWNLLSHFALVAAKVSGEDSAGRAKIAEMTAEETVAKCFDLADAFVNTAEKRGEVKAFSDQDMGAAFARGGKLEAARDAKR